jgi:hypothetical protein
MENKNLLLIGGAVAAVGAYFLLNKQTTVDAATAWAGGANTGVVPTGAAAVAAAALATSPTAAASAAAITANLPAGIAELSLKVGLDVATTLAVVKYDAIVYGHPDTLSTPYFLGNAQTWADGLANYQGSGIPQLAQKAGLDQATTLDVVAYDAVLYGHPTQLSTSVFLNSPNNWAGALTAYKAAKGLSGVAGGYRGPQPKFLG